MQQLLDNLDVIECFLAPDHALRIGEILDQQKEIYTKLGTYLPASL